MGLSEVLSPEIKASGENVSCFFFTCFFYWFLSDGSWRMSGGFFCMLLVDEDRAGSGSLGRGLHRRDEDWGGL